MYWTLELASYLSDAPWPATKDELIDYAISLSKTKEKSMNQWKRFGQIILLTKIIFGMRMNIKK